MLRQALPYLKEFSGKVFLIKAGGQIVSHHDFPQLIKDVATLAHLGILPIFVLGAGPQFDEKLLAKKIPFEKIDGVRITTSNMMPILSKITESDFEKIQKLFLQENIETVRIEKFLQAEEKKIPGIKFSHCTGTIFGIKKREILKILNSGKLPICFSIINEKNCNADEISLAIAEILKAEKVIFLTGTKGIFIENEKKETELLSVATPEILKKLIKKGDISGGMIAKAQAASKIIEAKIPQVHIISGLLDGTLLSEIFTKKGCGTMVVSKV